MTAAARRVTLRDVARIEREAVAPSRIESGTLYVGLENIRSGGEFVGVGPVHNGELASNKFTFTSKHVLYGKLRPYLAKIARPDFAGICSTDILPVLPGPELDRGFLTWLLLAPKMVSWAASRATGANLPRLSPHTLAKMEILLPPLPEQRRIAAILDQADALRAKRRTAIQKLDILTQSIFLDMFGDPATNPEDWPTPPLKHLFAVSPNFGTMIPPTSEGGEWLSLRVANIQDWQLDLADRKYVNLAGTAVSRHSVQDGDILLARAIASQELLGKAVVVYPKREKWAFDSHLVRLRFDPEQAEPEFIRCLLKTPGGRRLFLSATRRSAVQFNINTREIAALRLPIAPVSLQRRFSKLVTTIDRIRRKEREALDSLGAMFASLQQRAFRGEL